MLGFVTAWTFASRTAIRRSDAHLLAVLNEREDALADLVSLHVELEAEEDEVDRMQARRAELEGVEEQLRSLKVAATELGIPTPPASFAALPADELQKVRARIESHQERVELLVEQSNEFMERIRPSLDEPVKAPMTMLVRGFMLLLIVGSLVGLSIDDTPWLPTEEISLADGSMLTGYVLSENETYLTLLVHSPRSATMVKQESVAERQYCQGGRSDISRTLAQSIMRGRSLGDGYSFCEELVEIVDQDD